MAQYIQQMRKQIGNAPLQVVRADIFIHRDERILLQQRKSDGLWEPQNGYVELAESVEEGAKRAVFTQTQIAVQNLELLDVFSGKDLMCADQNGAQLHVVEVSYLCEYFSGQMQAEPQSLQALQWFSIDALPKGISPQYQLMLEHCLYVLQFKKSPIGVKGI